MKKIVLILALLFAFSSCEKDDICAKDTPGTPQVVIEFFEFNNQTQRKNVTKLKLREPNSTKELLTFTEISNIKIPLKSYEDFSNLELILNFDATNAATGNSDKINFNYSRTNEYISRACGYKTLFKLNAVNGTQLVADSNNWIKQITVIKPEILNETETHVKIYF